MTKLSQITQPRQMTQRNSNDPTGSMVHLAQVRQLHHLTQLAQVMKLVQTTHLNQMTKRSQMSKPT